MAELPQPDVAVQSECRTSSIEPVCNEQLDALKIAPALSSARRTAFATAI